MASPSYDEIPAALRVEDAARLLDCNPDTVRKLIRNGALASVRVGRLLRIPRHSLVALLEGEDYRALPSYPRGGAA